MARKSKLSLEKEKLAPAVLRYFFGGKPKGNSPVIQEIKPLEALAFAGYLGARGEEEINQVVQALESLDGYVYSDRAFSISKGKGGSIVITVSPFKPEPQPRAAATSKVAAVSFDIGPLVEAMENLMNAIAQQNQVITQMLQLLTEQMRRSEIYLKVLDEAYGLTKKYEQT